MDPELIRLLEETSSKLYEAETTLTQVQKATEDTTVPDEQLTALVLRHKAARELFESQKLKIFKTLVEICLLLPTHYFSMDLNTKTGWAVCIRPMAEKKIRVWKTVPFKEIYMTPERFAVDYSALDFSRSLIHQIREAVSNLKKVDDSLPELLKVARLYKELGTELETI